MISSSKFQFILFLLSVLSFSLIGVSLAADNLSVSPPFAATTSDVVTCPVPQAKCSSECDRRCSATSHVNNCLLFCNKCCNQCLCVPPGTYGNKECCPCYNNWKTKEGGPKCP